MYPTSTTTTAKTDRRGGERQSDSTSFPPSYPPYPPSQYQNSDPSAPNSQFYEKSSSAHFHNPPFDDSVFFASSNLSSFSSHPKMKHQISDMRATRKLLIFIVFIALLLDNMLLTSIGENTLPASPRPASPRPAPPRPAPPPINQSINQSTNHLVSLSLTWLQ